jgi:hypothetical protein
MQGDDMKSILLAALIVGLLVAGVPVSAQGKSGGKPLELKWDELAPMIRGQRVEITLADSTTVNGEAIAVRDDTVVLDVSGSSNPQTYPNGNGSIPRGAVVLVQVERSRNSGAKTLGTVVGVLAGVVVGGYVSGTMTESAGVGIPVFLGLASGITIVGYQAGKQMDRQVTSIRIVP